MVSDIVSDSDFVNSLRGRLASAWHISQRQDTEK